MSSNPTGTERRMTDAEALMWSVEADPALRSAFMSVSFLDRSPDFERFRARVAAAVAGTPGLRQRVAAPSRLELLTPRWEPDPEFDLDLHLRRVVLPPPGTPRQALDLAAALCQEPFDRSRPLWQFTVVEGLEGGGAALLAKMHHVLSDGVGAIRMSAAFLDLSPDGDPLATPPSDTPSAAPLREEATAPQPGGVVGVLGTVGGAAGSMLHDNLEAARRAAGGVLGSMRQPQHLPRQAMDTVALARSLARQLAVVQPARSPLWSGRHSLIHRFDVLSLDLAAVKKTAGRLGGTVNDVFVTAVVGAAGAYHQARGVDVAELRMSMPVSIRHDRAVGGNAWVPTRMLVPAGEADPVARFAEVHQRLERAKHEPSLGLTDAFAGIVRGLPGPLLVRLARQQTGTVDFACSNVRGAPFRLWIGGARVLASHPMGPTAGTAFNATVLSYEDRLDLGLNVDAGAVGDGGELRDLIDASFAELFAAGG